MSRVLKAVNEASISVACLLDDVAVNKSSELNLSELQKDVEHLQDQITMLENYLEAYRFILEERKE
jgi:ACT domain-containing protein